MPDEPRHGARIADDVSLAGAAHPVAVVAGASEQGGESEGRGAKARRVWAECTQSLRGN
jgi:hypothetical protein